MIHVGLAMLHPQMWCQLLR